MDTLFLQILNMSITASYVVLFVIVARLLLKRVPKIFSYALWSVVFFRLISPFSYDSMFSLVPVSTQTVPTNIMYSQIHTINSSITVMDQTVNNSMMSAPVVEVSVNPLQLWITLGEILWIFGIAVLLIYSFFTAIKLYMKLKPASLIFDNVYTMHGIKTPFIFGILKPKIYLPIGLTEKGKNYIIKHEQTHIKRLDHIIKPLAFLILCVHWFNPLVWAAFFLMSEDMEMSCDESVIKQMGSEIKKDYSTSLLFLATGRRIIGGSPLAFGENNTKGRIINILNYKKPRFWAIIGAVIAVVVISVGLMSNPPKEQWTVEEYAEQFVKEKIEFYSTAYKTVDSKITKLEKIASLDQLLPSNVEIWSLEYRLKPDDISNVMLAGGMNAIDGWITEDESMGKPLLVFSYEGSKLQYLGYMKSGEADFSNLAGQEIALRIFLEGKGLLENVSYKGNHILVQFQLSTGETSQLLVSQPVIQGEQGIWCVERWMDGNGTVYYVTPETDIRIAEYYKELQKQSDDGTNLSLLDPMQVATDFIINDLGQGGSVDNIVLKYSAKPEDFYKTPESHFIGFISNFSKESASFHLDKIEWLTLNDTQRLKELNIDPNDLNGFYIYNPDSYPMYFQVTEQTEYNIINWDEGAVHKSVTMEEFIDSFKKYSDFTPPFRIITKDGYVQSITEQYVP
ncbi:M56 family metallopeptidase [Alkaliphilus peptidifermentans]|uniref:Signal transducer regulating beta-lactamase production, contains metallopeptidase domain n=1 Tax=Alkaliphilus peptidifermentans DSM 18978 TaxID=1120976 RepID=A0A1G5BS20_9FIRM|nr:M56 family metallopeptidase [Alkaliphilus peptidifermentans]SCX92923.1 Signal transducer regulating beta-lactamase production, contains metallopeptidase domain [Alkaliphilus peptidifermentans DSM 18978]